MSSMHRRQFLAVGSAALASLVVPWGCANPGQRRAARIAASTAGRVAKGAQLRLAIVGVANQGGSNLGAVQHERIVALCDVDAGYLSAAAARFPEAKTFVDFRELLSDDSLDLDGVVISTPDHTHAPAAAMALRNGLPTYLEKPLTHTVEECRTLAHLAASNRVITQMGTLIHAGSNYRRVVEMIRSGAIGEVTQVDTWCPKSWCCGKLTPGAHPPAALRWDLWQGPIPEAEYVDGITPANWRSHWRYGTGTLGDMGCHILDLPMWALGLDDAKWSRCEVRAEGPPLDAVGCPAWLEVSWAFPQAGRDPLVVRWFDGGRIPPTVQEIGAKDRQDYFGRFMVCFQGTRGFLLANYGEMLVLQAGDVHAPPPSIPESIGHHKEWLQAIRAGRNEGEGSPLCRFSYAATLTELVLSGTVAYRAGRPIIWDRRRPITAMDADVRALCTEPYRQGWSV